MFIHLKMSAIRGRVEDGEDEDKHDGEGVDPVAGDGDEGQTIEGGDAKDSSPGKKNVSRGKATKVKAIHAGAEDGIFGKRLVAYKGLGLSPCC